MPAITPVTDRNVEVEVAVYSVVITKGRLHEIQAYLYDHTTVDGGEAYFTSERWNVYLLKTTASSFLTFADCRSSDFPLDKIRRHATDSATYQCERLQSGLHSAIAAVGDWHEACEVASEYL